MKDDLFKTKDKKLAPYLLTCKEIRFEGTYIIGTTVFFNFFPFETALNLTNKYLTHKAELVDPKILLEAVETYRDIIFEMKNK